jgi:phage-related protein
MARPTQRGNPSARVLRRGGAIALDDPRDQPRSVTLRGTVTGTTVQDARDKADALKLALRKNSGAQITFDDLLTRFINARVQSVKVPPFGPSMIQRKLSVEVTLTVLDPYSYDITQTVTTLDNTVRRLQLGTGPSLPIITIAGATVNPVLTFFKYDGTILGTMNITFTGISSDTLVINCDSKTVTLNGVNRLDLLTTGDFFRMEPLTSQLGLGVAAGDRPYITASADAATSRTTAFNRAWR